MSVKEKILPGNYYHLYNHSNGGFVLFKNDWNYHYFLEKYLRHLGPYVDTLAYCLMPEHFHFLVRVKDSCNKESSDLFKRSELPLEISPKKVTNAIKNWLISYTQSYHKVYHTRGNLFYQKIRRTTISNKSQLINLILYIHLNPVIHGLSDKPEDWIHGSYNNYLNNHIITYSEAIKLFSTQQNFIQHHNTHFSEDFLENVKSDLKINSPVIHHYL